MNTSAKKVGAFAGAQHESIADALLVQLTEDLGTRRIDAGIAKLQEYASLFTALSPSQPNAGRFTGAVALWVDVGFESAELVRDMLARFSQKDRAALPVTEYIHLRMADGFVAMSD